MKKLIFKKIDAFASNASTGNPAAVVYLDSMGDLSPQEMLQLAKEFKGFVSEVGYVAPGSDTDFCLRYFSSEREVAFCGHATIAILNDLIASNKALEDKPMLSIATQTDRLMVENRYKDEKSVYISAPSPRFSDRTVNIADIASALQCSTSHLDHTLPVQIVNGGLETLVVPMAGLDSILAVSPDLHMLNDFCKQIEVDIIILYSEESATQNCAYRTRVFAPTFGYLEDPATGSGNAAFGYYLLRNDMWDGERIRLEQNGCRDQPNFVQILAKNPHTEACQVWFGGGAVVKIEGQYLLQNETKFF